MNPGSPAANKPTWFEHLPGQHTHFVILGQIGGWLVLFLRAISTTGKI